MPVPFLDLKAQYQSIKDEIAAALQDVLDNTAFAGGKFVEQFENEYAEFCDCSYAVGNGSGTEALWLALLALGVGPGDEVITAVNTFIATAEAISYSGATPVFVDIDDKTYNIDPGLIEQAITSKTKAIIPVHLYGQMADMDPIMDIAKANNLYVIEDSSQSHGAEYKGKRAGSIGDIGCFSFYPGKNLGAYGEAGACVTSNQEWATKMTKYRDHGQSKKYYHDYVGWNARMDGFQGAVLNVKLKHLPQWTEMRRTNAETYSSLLQDVNDIILPYEADSNKHVYHIYSIRHTNRDYLLEQLRERGINCALHYPVPLHLQKAYAFLGYNKGAFPVAEKCVDEQLSLPMFPELTREQIEFVAKELKSLIS